MTIQEKILYGGLLFFFGALFYAYTDTINGIVIALLLLYAFFFVGNFKSKWGLLKERKHIAFMMLFILLLLISILFSDNTGRGFRYLDTRLALFYFPLGLGLLQLTKPFKEKSLLGFALVTTVVAAGLLVYGIYAATVLNKPELLYNDSLTAVIGRQSVYVALLVNISVFILSYWIFYKPVSGKKQALLLSALCLLLVFSYFLASRSMMLLLFAVAIGFIFHYILTKKKYLEGATLLMALGIGVFLVFKFFPQTLNRFRELTYTQFEYSNRGAESHYNMEVTADQWNGANFRLAAWQCGWELFLQHPLTGVGLGDKQDELVRAYAKKGFQFGIDTKKNVHNNYLDVLISTGIIGLAVFLVGWLGLPLYYSARQRDWLAVLIIGSIGIALFTEVYFDRTVGGMIVGFFVPFLLTDYRKEVV